MIVLGILSRQISAVPLFVGDMLYAVMVYFGCRMLFTYFNHLKKIIVPLLICYLIELQQLSEVAWLLSIRNTTLGHYALGQGFLWSDLICYTLGVAVAYFLDYQNARFIRY